MQFVFVAPLKTSLLGLHVAGKSPKARSTNTQKKNDKGPIGSSNLETLKPWSCYASWSCLFLQFACCAIRWNNILLAQKLWLRELESVLCSSGLCKQMSVLFVFLFRCNILVAYRICCWFIVRFLVTKRVLPVLSVYPVITTGTHGSEKHGSINVPQCRSHKELVTSLMPKVLCCAVCVCGT